uniref:RNA-directed RNA polymerase 2a n=1 Tax=Tobacco streak virus TaxID=12317 RepID=A0A1S6XXI5_9BROM|nr:RNA dependent RNA polymerase [Tobacco streak virus]
MDSVIKNLIVYHLSRRIDVGSSFGIEPADFIDWVKLFFLKFIVEHTARFIAVADIHTTMLLVLGTDNPDYEEKDTSLILTEIDPFYLPYDDLDVDYTSLRVFGDEYQSCSDRDDLTEFVSNISHIPEGTSWGSESDTSFVEHLEEIQGIPTKMDLSDRVVDDIPFDDDGKVIDEVWVDAEPSRAPEVSCDADVRACGFRFIRTFEKLSRPKWTPKVSQVKPDPSVIQSAVDELFPHHHSVDDRFFQEWVETHDIDLEVTSCDLDLSVFNDWTKGVDTRLVPHMSVGGLSHRVPTQREALLAIKKRNMNVPELQSSFDHDDVLNRCVTRFITHVVDKTRLSKLNPISGEELYYFNQYLENKNPPLSEYKGPVPLVALDKYMHMKRTTLRPVEEDSLHIERPIPATITYHKKGVVMMTSPYFLCAMVRLLYVLKSKFVVPTGKYHQIFQMNPELLKHSKEFKEIDFSKFDKSQGRLHHDVQFRLFMALGIPEHFVTTWFNSHERSHIRDRDCGIGFSVDYQRRTGDACTYLGNTLVTLSVLSYVYDLSDPNILFVAASGDDSLIGSRKPLPREKEDLCVSLFNFETKFPHNQPFICSKFLLVVECDDGSEEVLAVPNPLKLLQKFGPKNLQVTVLDDYYQSLCDILWVFNDADVCRRTAELAEYRRFKGTKKCLFLESALLSLPSLVANRMKFVRRTINLESSKVCIRDDVYSDLVSHFDSRVSRCDDSEGVRTPTSDDRSSSEHASVIYGEARGRIKPRRNRKSEGRSDRRDQSSGIETGRAKPSRKGRVKLH